MVTLKDQNQATIYTGNSTNGAGVNTFAMSLGTFTNPISLEITNSSSNQTFEIDNITLTQDGIEGVSYYTAQLVSAQDYYPFGTTLPGRTFQDDRFSGYRFSFNGKEKDKEGMGGGGSTYDYGFRIYNPQLGKFLSIDPLARIYPYYTPYQFAGNKPAIAIDLQGLQPLFMIGTNGKLKDPVISLLNSAFNFDANVMRQSYWIHYKAAKSGQMWFAITGNPTASVSGTTVYHDANDHSDAEWLGLIAHEESHRQEISKRGNFDFYVGYIGEGLRKSYKEINTEKTAYKYGADYSTSTDMMDQLLDYKSGIVMTILKNESLNESQKALQLGIVGKEFRLEKIINPTLNNINTQIQNIQSKIKEYKGDKLGLDALNSQLSNLNTAQKIYTEEKSKIENELKQ